MSKSETLTTGSSEKDIAEAVKWAIVNGPRIHVAIVAIMNEVGAVGKAGTSSSQQGGYKYRKVDDVYAALQLVMSKHGVHTTTEVLDERTEERQTKSGGHMIYRILKIRFTFWALDGSSVVCVTMGEGQDSGDKASNKAMAVAHKYALCQVFCIPTDEPKDPEHDPSQELRPKGSTDKGQQTAAPSGQDKSEAKKKLTPREVAAVIERSFADLGKASGTIIDRTMIEKIAGAPLDKLSQQQRDMLRALASDLTQKKVTIDQVFGQTKPAAQDLNEQFG